MKVGIATDASLHRNGIVTSDRTGFGTRAVFGLTEPLWDSTDPGCVWDRHFTRVVTVTSLVEGTGQVTELHTSAVSFFPLVDVEPC